MNRKDSSVGIRLLLLFLGLLGVGSNLVVFLGLPRFEPPKVGKQENLLSGQASASTVRGLYSVKAASCTGENERTGTAFAVSSVYLVTIAQVVMPSRECDAAVVVTNNDTEQGVELAGLSEDSNLALLKLAAPYGGNIRLAESALYEQGHEGARVVLALPSHSEAPPGDTLLSAFPTGELVRFDTSRALFEIRGLNPIVSYNGAPVILESDGRVLGVLAIDPSARPQEGINNVIPSDRIRALYLQATSQSLE